MTMIFDCVNPKPPFMIGLISIICLNNKFGNSSMKTDRMENLEPCYKEGNTSITSSDLELRDTVIQKNIYTPGCDLSFCVKIRLVGPMVLEKLANTQIDAVCY